MKAVLVSALLGATLLLFSPDAKGHERVPLTLSSISTVIPVWPVTVQGMTGQPPQECHGRRTCAPAGGAGQPCPYILCWGNCDGNSKLCEYGSQGKFCVAATETCPPLNPPTVVDCGKEKNAQCSPLVELQICQCVTTTDTGNDCPDEANSCN